MERDLISDLRLQAPLFAGLRLTLERLMPAEAAARFLSACPEVWAAPGYVLNH